MSIPADLRHKIEESKVLLVGAGGIGCEVLKNLTLSGFKRIDAVDLDTIDVSNLNRQFLFNKSNVGQSKAEVAIDIVKREYAAQSQDGLELNAIHKSIISSEFDVDFFRNYTFVINALDNRAARSHVNRMCLSSETPLLESGTAGYTGQSTLIKNSLTACYECDGIQAEGKTYATCTIRNTPSQPIHCIVWAKHLFHQLFGEDDPDNDVSPQMETSDTSTQVANANSNGINGINGSDHMDSKDESPKKDQSTPKSIATNENKPSDTTARAMSTRQWATEQNYDPVLLIQKLYNDDIHYLLSMDNLWKERAKPTPLDYSNLIQDSTSAPQSSSFLNNNHNLELGNQRLWSIKECVDMFSECVIKLYQKTKTSGYLQWDKDDEVALNFVVAASNLRSKCFNIDRKSPFDVKSLAGNIVPAISSTNSIIGGLLVLQAIRLLKAMPIGEEYRRLDDTTRNDLLKDVGRASYLCYTSLLRQDLITSFECLPPVSTCLACAKGNTPELELHLSIKNSTLADLVDKIILGKLHFVCPDISYEENIIYSHDDDSSDAAKKSKKLAETPFVKPPKTRLLVTDLLQDKEIVLVLIDEETEFLYATMNNREVLNLKDDS